jgi:hypothetical protein
MDPNVTPTSYNATGSAELVLLYSTFLARLTRHNFINSVKVHACMPALKSLCFLMLIKYMSIHTSSIQGESKKPDTFDIQMNNKGVSFF